jgi:cell division protein FtsB
MTIIEPNKNKFNLNFLMIFAIGLIVCAAVLSIFAYATSVKIDHAISSYQKNLDRLKAESADLKNDLYAILDFQNADQLAEKLGLIKERKPEYLAIIQQ